jgi:hypothetical protein
MPVRYVIYKKHRLVLTVGEGYVTADEIKTHQDQLLADPAFDPSFSQLIDVTTTLTLALSPQETKEIAHRRIVGPNSKRAFVASSIHVFVMGRLMELYHEEHHEVDVHIFEHRDEALQWLGVPEDSGLY